MAQFAIAIVKYYFLAPSILLLPLGSSFLLREVELHRHMLIGITVCRFLCVETSSEVSI